MKIQYSLLCDHAFLSIDRKVNIIGVFETINAGSFPVTHNKFVLVGSILPSKDKFKMAVDIVSEKTKISVLRQKQERDISLPAENQGKNFNFIIEILNTEFPEKGIYNVEIIIDGKTISSQDLLLSKAEEFRNLN